MEMGCDKETAGTHHDRATGDMQIHLSSPSCTSSSSWYQTDTLKGMESGSNQEYEPVTPHSQSESCHRMQKNDRHRDVMDIHMHGYHVVKAPKVKSAMGYTDKLFQKKEGKIVKESFMCPEVHCGKHFPRSFALRRHMRIHTGVKPYKCDFEGCTQRFNTSGNLSRHKRIHSGERPYPCIVPTCEKRFNTSTKLKRHMRSHYPDGEHLFRCIGIDCSWSSDNYKDFVQHQKLQHNILTKYNHEATDHTIATAYPFAQSVASPMDQSVFAQASTSRTFANTNATIMYSNNDYIDRNDRANVSERRPQSQESYGMAARAKAHDESSFKHPQPELYNMTLSQYQCEHQRKNNEVQGYEIQNRMKLHHVRSPSPSTSNSVSSLSIAAQESYPMESEQNVNRAQFLFNPRSAGVDSSMYSSSTHINTASFSNRTWQECNYNQPHIASTPITPAQRNAILASIHQAPLLRPPPRSPIRDNVTKEERYPQQPYNNYPVPPMQPAAPEFTGEELSVVLELMK